MKLFVDFIMTRLYTIKVDFCYPKEQAVIIFVGFERIIRDSQSRRP